MTKKTRYIFGSLFTVLFLFMSVLITIEGATPGNESGHQSKFFASIFDFGPKQATVVHPESLSIHGENTLYIGKTNSYSATFEPSDTTDQRVSWSILSGEEFASVDSQKGTLFGLNEGEVLLKAISLADDSIFGTFSLQVKKEPIKTLELSLDQSEILVGTTAYVSLKADIPNYPVEDIGYSFSDPDLISLDENHYLHGLRAGITSFYAYYKKNDSVKSQTITLTIKEETVVPVSSLEVKNETLYVGQTLDVNPTFNELATDRHFLLSTSQEGISLNYHTISASKAGTYAVRATSAYDPSKTCDFTVEFKDVKPKAIHVSSVSLQYGKTERVPYSLDSEVEGLPVTDTRVHFQSSNPSVANVDENGYIIGYQKGSVSITVSYSDSVCGSADIQIVSMEPDKFDHINLVVRKLVGHYGSFLVTGIFGFFALFFFFFDQYKGYKIPLLFAGINLVYAFLLACLSELLQINNPGRGPAFRDVMIDWSGSLTSILILSLIFILIRNSFKKKKEKPVSLE